MPGEQQANPDQTLEPGNSSDEAGGATLTKADIVERVYRTCTVTSRREASDIVENVLAQICDSIARGENIKISGFGTFRIMSKAERTGRNPMTGVSAPISARKVVQFSASPIVKKAMNKEQQD